MPRALQGQGAATAVGVGVGEGEGWGWGGDLGHHQPFPLPAGTLAPAGGWALGWAGFGSERTCGRMCLEASVSKTSPQVSGGDQDGNQEAGSCGVARGAPRGSSDAPGPPTGAQLRAASPGAGSPKSPTGRGVPRGRGWGWGSHSSGGRGLGAPPPSRRPPGPLPRAASSERPPSSSSGSGTRRDGAARSMGGGRTKARGAALGFGQRGLQAPAEPPQPTLGPGRAVQLSRPGGGRGEGAAGAGPRGARSPPPAAPRRRPPGPLPPGVPSLLAPILEGRAGPRPGRGQGPQTSPRCGGQGKGGRDRREAPHPHPAHTPTRPARVKPDPLRTHRPEWRAGYQRLAPPGSTKRAGWGGAPGEGGGPMQRGVPRIGGAF